MVNRRDLIKLGVLASTGLVGTVNAQETTTAQMEDEEASFFVAALLGNKQVPPVETAATGLAMFAVGDDGIDYALGVSNIENMLMAHIHVGGPDENGPVGVWLDPSVEAREPELREGATSGISAQGTITSEDFVGPLEGESLDSLAEMMQAREVYVNVHTQQNEAGEIRGQTRSVAGIIDVLS
jgi:hypothetical protein